MNSREKIPQQLQRQIKQAFNSFDRDGDGAITIKQLSQVLNQLGQNPTEDQLRQLVAQMDSDGNRIIDYQQFLNLVQNRLKQQDSQYYLIQAFRILDRDCDGIITKQELLNCIKFFQEIDITEENLDQILSQSQIKDGLSYQDFLRLMNYK